MKIEEFLKNDRAVSISVGFILMFAITVLVFTALIISFYTLSQGNEKTVMRESFRIVGGGLATKITVTDAMINIIESHGGTVNELEYEFDFPPFLAGRSYTVNVTSSPGEIIMESEDLIKIATPFNISTNLTERKLYSGAENYQLTYDQASNSINIEEI